MARNSISSYWQQFEQLVGPGLQRRRLRNLLEDRGRVPGFQAVGHPRSGGQIGHQGRKTVYRKSVLGLVGALLLGRFRRLRWPDRIPSFPFLSPLLIFEQNRRPGSTQMPFHVVGQQAEKKMRRHPLRGAMVNRSHPQLNPFQAAKSALDFRETLVASHSRLRREALLRLAGANHVDPIQLRFLWDGLFSTLPLETPLADRVVEVLTHFVAPEHLAHLEGNLRRLQELLLPPRHLLADLR